MIFATVGTQLPFPRLMAALDAIAATNDEEIIAQTGAFTDTNPGPVKHLSLREHLTPDQFQDLFTSARIVVAHAGIGTILSAKHHGKPLVLLPRRHALGEHRNDHQLATAKQVERLPGIHIAWEETDLAGLLTGQDLSPADNSMSPSRAALLDRLRGFIDG